MFGLGSQMALRIVSFVFQILIVNRLGGEQFGQYSIVIAWAGLFSVIGDLGISQYFAREIARDHEKTSLIYWDVVILRSILAVFAASITILGAILHPYDPMIVLGIAIYTFSYFLQAFLVPLQAIISGNERVDIISVFEVISQIIFITTGALFLFAGLSFVWLVIASILNIPVITYLSYRVVRHNKLGPPRFRITPNLWWGLILSGLPFGLTQLSLSFAYRVDTVILSSHVSDEQIGWYNIAYGLILTLLTVTRAFNSALAPTLTREHALNPEKTQNWYYRSVKMLLFLGLPIAVGGMITSHKIIDLLYQPEILPAAIPLAILVWDIPFVMYQSFSGTFTQSIQKERRGALNYGTLAICNLLLNLFLIPRFGIIGSSFATVATDMIGSCLFYLLLRHELGAGLGFRRLVRIPLSAAIMGLVVFIIRDAHLFIDIGIGAAVYLTFVWVTGVFTPEERQRMVGIIERRVRRLVHA
jgi:O-antigen/teichoic acid export membrane protein